MALVAISCMLVAPAPMDPVSPLCDDGSYRVAHPLICDTGQPMPGGLPGSAGGGGNENHGGILGGILGGLTGGLL